MGRRETEIGKKRPGKRSSLSAVSPAIFTSGPASLRPEELSSITSGGYIGTVGIYWAHALCQLLF